MPPLPTRILLSSLVLALTSPAFAEEAPEAPPFSTPAPPHSIRFGFAIDSLKDIRDAQVAYDAAIERITADGMVSGNGFPDITVNRVTGIGWNTTSDPVLPVSRVQPWIADMLMDANVMVGMADIPFDQVAAGWTCSDLPLNYTVPPDIYGPTTDACSLLTQYTYRSGYPPIFNSHPLSSLVEFDHTDWQLWAEELSAALPDGSVNFVDPRTGSALTISIGDLSWETGNEPDGRFFFWGDHEEYLGKAFDTWTGVRNGDGPSRVTPIYYGGFGSATTFDIGKAGPTASTVWDLWRGTIADYRLHTGPDPDYGYSFHWFRNPGFGQIGHPWQEVMAGAWPAANVERTIISAWDLWGRIGNGRTGDPELWKSALENSSYLPYELAGMLHVAHERDIEAVYFWKLLDQPDITGPSGFFTPDPVVGAEPLAGYDHLLDVWRVVEGGYRSVATSDGLEIRGENDWILRTRDGGSGQGPIPQTDDMFVIACKQQDLELPPPDSLVGDAICTTWQQMDWVIYREVEPGQGQHCPSERPTTLDPCAPTAPDPSLDFSIAGPAATTDDGPGDPG